MNDIPEIDNDDDDTPQKSKRVPTPTETIDIGVILRSGIFDEEEPQPGDPPGQKFWRYKQGWSDQVVLDVSGLAAVGIHKGHIASIRKAKGGFPARPRPKKVELIPHEPHPTNPMFDDIETLQKRQSFLQAQIDLLKRTVQDLTTSVENLLAFVKENEANIKGQPQLWNGRDGQQPPN